jgi:hypothetical protein
MCDPIPCEYSHPQLYLKNCFHSREETLVTKPQEKALKREAVDLRLKVSATISDLLYMFSAKFCSQTASRRRANVAHQFLLDSLFVQSFQPEILDDESLVIFVSRFGITHFA